MAASTTRTVKAKFDGDAKGLVAAAAEGERAIDHLGSNTEKKFKKSGEKAAKSFGTSIKKWFGGSGGLKEIGDSGGTVFGSGFLGALKTPVLGPAIAAVMAAAVAVALPAVGAVAASGMVAGFGAGLAGLGIVFAAKSADVKRAWSTTLSSMGADMTRLSKPFESTLISIAGFADRTFQKFKPSLEAVFKDLAPSVTIFADQLTRGLESLEPAVRPLSEAFQAVLRSLGPAMQSALSNVSRGLQNLSESVKKNPDGLSDLVDGVGALTNKALGAITALNNLNGAITFLTGGTSAVDILFGKANGAIGTAISTVQRGINPFTGLKDVVGLLGTETASTGAEIQDQAATLGLWTQGLTASQVAAMGITGAQASAGAAVESATTKYERQKRATDALIQSLFRLQGLALGLSGAQIAYQAAIDDATASLKENGRTLDIHTAKGRANQSSLLSVAQAANTQTQSMLESNKGTAAAARAAEGSRANFIRLAVQMGATVPQARAMAASMIAIPNVTRTAKLNANISDLQSRLRTAKAELADKNLTKERRAQLNAEISKLEAGIARAKAALAGVPASKTVTITTNFREVHTVIRGSQSSSAGRGGGHEETGRASGGLMQPGRRYLLGERRSEIVEMGQNGGARVVSGEQTPRELAGGRGEPMVAEIHIEIGGEVVRVVRTELKADKRDTKRKAQAR